MPEARQENSSKNERFLNLKGILLGVAIGLLLVWLTVRDINWRQVREALEGFSWPFGLLAIACLLLSGFLRAYRWRLLLLKEKIRTRRLFLVQNTGIGLNNLVPLRVLSEAAQFVILTLRDRMDAGVVLATLALEKIIDLLITASILGVGLLFFPQLQNLWPYIAVIIVVSFTGLVFLLFLSPRTKKIPLIHRLPLAGSFSLSMDMLAHNKRRLLASLLTTAGYWVLVGLSGWLVASGLGLDLSLPVVTIVVLGTTLFATVVPSLPAAVGGFEFAFVYLVGFFGVDRELALSFAIITHFVLFAPPVAIALVVLAGERTSLRDVVSFPQRWRAALGSRAAM